MRISKVLTAVLYCRRASNLCGERQRALFTPRCGYPNLHRSFQRAAASSGYACFKESNYSLPCANSSCEFRSFHRLYFTVVELLIYAASASEHRSRRGVVTLTYIDPPSERYRALSICVFRRATTLCPVLILMRVSKFLTAVLYCRRASNLCAEC